MKNIFQIFSKKKQQLSNISYLMTLFENKNGLEIGGPSNFFSKKGPLSIYQKIKTLDGANFSAVTIWGTENPFNGFIVDREKKGDLYITDATDLNCIKKNTTLYYHATI